MKVKVMDFGIVPDFVWVCLSYLLSYPGKINFP